MRVQDLSVSKDHAVIDFDYESGSFRLRDTKSRFGTLKLVQEPILIEEDVNVSVQVQKFYINFSVVFEEASLLKKMCSCFKIAKADNDQVSC